MASLDIKSSCKELEDSANQQLIEECGAKKFVIDSGRPCPKTFDLVVLIDTSGSMRDEAPELSKRAAVAVEAARQSCAPDLRDAWFGIEGTFGTKFTRSYRSYLVDDLGVSQDDLVGRFDDPHPPSENSKEEGAAAIQNIANFYNWEEGASRIILFLGDEALKEGNPQNDDDIKAADEAIRAAKKQNVTVNMYYGTPGPNSSPDTPLEYQRVARETGGSFLKREEPVDFQKFQEFVQEVICCKRAGIPELLPCFKLSWGDGPKDQIETTDTECLCITACNRYANVTFKDLTVIISEITKGGAPVPNLPDGTPSVFIKPSKFICFGDLGPCTPNNNPNEPDQLSCISRELVLVSSGALEGEYILKIDYCYSVHFDLKGEDEFVLPLYAS
jgi:(2Fe-2S) ferredoxin